MPRILYVEDNDDNVYMLRQRLQRKGFTVSVAVDGEAGLAVAREELPDLVLLDLGLPLLDGWQVAQALKADPRTRAIPIIALSAHAMADDRAQALAAGCEDYDTKPVDLPRLLGKMRALLAPDSPRVTAGARILVVDDNEDNLYTLTERLKREGYADLVTASDGAAALDRLAAEPFDLVLLDVMMPVLDGIDTLARIKADPELRHIPVIMISAASDQARVVRCLELGAEDYLPKPFDRVILRARVGASLDRKRLRDTERAHLAEIEAQRTRLDACLHAMLPAPAVAELAASGRIAPRRYEGVAVMFADIIGFTAYCDCHAAEGVVAELDLFARVCERLAAANGLEKIKTVGDAVLLTGNLLIPHPEPVRACVACADAMIETAVKLPGRWRVRAGIQLGPVVAGMVGEEKFGFDIWGDTVNLAARLSELTSDPGIHLGGAAANRVRGVVGLADLGQVTLKGAGASQVFRALQPAPEAR